MQHIRAQRIKSRSVNRLNIRMRSRASVSKAALSNRVNLKAIREIETALSSFDHDHLELLSREFDTDVMERPAEQEEIESWSLDALDYETLDGAQHSDKAILGWCLNVLSISPIADAVS